MRRKIFENKIVRKSIVWAMTFMMAFSSVGGSMTVYATEAPTEGEILNESSDSVAEAAEIVAEAADTASAAAEAAKDAAAAAETAADAAEALEKAIYGESEETEEGEETGEGEETEKGEEAGKSGVVEYKDVVDPVTGETKKELVTIADDELDAAKDAIDDNNAAVDTADGDMSTISGAKDSTEKAQQAAEGAKTKAETAKNDAKAALEAVLNAPADSPEGNQEAAAEAAKTAQIALDAAIEAEDAAKTAKESAEKDVEDAKKAYEDLVVQLDAIDTADAANKLAKAETELEAAQAAFAEAEKAYNEAMKQSEDAKIIAKDAEAVKEAVEAVEQKGTVAEAAVGTIKDKLAEVKTDVNYDTLVTDDKAAKEALASATEAAEKAENENRDKISTAESELNEYNSKKAELDGVMAGLKSEKAAADSVIDKGDSWWIWGYETNIEHYKDVAGKKPGSWKYWPVSKWSKDEINYAKNYVAAYNSAKTVSSDKQASINEQQKLINAQQELINAKQSELDGYNKIINDANDAKAKAENAAAVASTRLSAVNTFLYSGDANSYEMTEEEAKRYEELQKEMANSATEYKGALDDTIKYIDATNEKWYEVIVGMFTGDTWKNLCKELDLEEKYHDEVWYGTDGTCYVLKSDKNNSNFLIAMTNGKFVASKVDEMEAAAFKASFDAIVAADASSAAAKDIQREADALAAYQEAKAALEAAQLKYENLAELKTTEATLKQAEQSLNNAKAAAEAAAEAYTATVVNRKLTENYYKWADALAATQMTHAFVQISEDGEPVTTNTRFDLTDDGVKGVSVDHFNPMTYEGKKQAGDKGIEVPYELYKKYVSVMYDTYVFDYKSNTDEFKAGTELKSKNGKGIAHESIESAVGVIYWVIGEDGLLTGDYYMSEEGMPSGTYFVAYSFKNHPDGNHLDGVIFEYTAPENTDNTPAGGGTTTGGGAGGGGRAAGTAGDVLGAKREDLAIVSEEGDVLGATRAPKTSDASKAILWMLVMGSSAIGAAAVLASKKKEA
ncbi:MAG: hypothetical protein ACI4FV_06520 [Lachnospiraceae bacterium]